MENQNTQDECGPCTFSPSSSVVGPLDGGADNPSNCFYQKTSYPDYDFPAGGPATTAYEAPQSMLNGDPNDSDSDDNGLENLYQIKHGTFTQVGTIPFPCETYKFSDFVGGYSFATAWVTQPRDRKPTKRCRDLDPLCSGVANKSEMFRPTIICNPPCENGNAEIPTEAYPDEAGDYYGCLNRLVDRDEIIAFNNAYVRPCGGLEDTCPNRCTTPSLPAGCEKPLEPGYHQDVELHRNMCEEFGDPYARAASGVKIFADRRRDKFRSDAGTSAKFGEPRQKRNGSTARGGEDPCSLSQCSDPISCIYSLPTIRR
jgi:hypothetical protein